MSLVSGLWNLVWKRAKRNPWPMIKRLLRNHPESAEHHFLILSSKVVRIFKQLRLRNLLELNPWLRLQKRNPSRQNLIRRMLTWTRPLTIHPAYLLRPCLRPWMPKLFLVICLCNIRIRRERFCALPVYLFCFVCHVGYPAKLCSWPIDVSLFSLPRSGATFMEAYKTVPTNEHDAKDTRSIASLSTIPFLARQENTVKNLLKLFTFFLLMCCFEYIRFSWVI